MNSNFEDVFYLYLIDKEYRQEMIDCGINLMMKGDVSEGVVLLASAVSETDNEIVKLFINSANEIGIELPEEAKYREWISRYSIKVLILGKNIPDFCIQKQFQRNLFFAYIELSKYKKENSVINCFLSAFHKQVYERQVINNYENWLGELSVIQNTLDIEEIQPIVGNSISRIIDLIRGSSYSAIEKSHYDESFKIAKDLALYSVINS